MSNKSKEKYFYYVAPPEEKYKLSKMEQQVLDIVKEFGQTSLVDICKKIMSDFDVDEKNIPFSRRYKITSLVIKVSASLIALVKKDCVRIEEILS